MTNIDKLRKEYQHISPNANKYAVAIKEQIEEILESSDIRLGVPIEYRVKSWDSLQAKLDRKSIKLNSVLDLNDLIGIRLILLFLKDVELVSKRILEHFVVLNVEDTVHRLAEDEFGYQSTHYQIKLPDSWLSIPSMKSFGKFQTELQVRTLAQHIWAATSHVFQYKNEKSVPFPVRRSIYRVSALLETADLEFDRVLEERKNYLKSIDPIKSKQELNVDLLEGILDNSWPLDNKDPEDDYSDLLDDLNYFKIELSNQLLKLISEYRDDVLKDEVTELIKYKEKDLPRVVKDRIERGVFYTHVGLTRLAMSIKFGEKWNIYKHSYVVDTYKIKKKMPNNGMH